MKQQIVSDMRLGLRQSPQDLVIAALVMASLALAPTLVVSSMAWWPSLLMVVLFMVIAVPATLWNAGWRARTSAQDRAGA